jgi:hypothetical protein
VIITPRAVTVADLALVPSPPRTEGTHVSTLIKALCEALEPERFSGEMDYTRFEVGYAVERAIERAWAERHITVIRPGEFTVNGITGSPDGVSFEDDGTIVIEEIKCTWMSSRGCPEDRKFWHWIVQMKAYAHLLGTDRARLHVLFVNGNYADERTPQYRSWDFQFTTREIEENWAMLRNQADAVRRQTP